MSTPKPTAGTCDICTYKSNRNCNKCILNPLNQEGIFHAFGDNFNAQAALDAPLIQALAKKPNIPLPNIQADLPNPHLVSKQSVANRLALLQSQM